MKSLLRALPAIAAFLTVSQAQASIISGIEFPQGALSFADQVVNFAQGGR
jgi:hypothetical protein